LAISYTKTGTYAQISKSFHENYKTLGDNFWSVYVNFQIKIEKEMEKHYATKLAILFPE
jgi:hypothetical protein